MILSNVGWALVFGFMAFWHIARAHGILALSEGIPVKSVGLFSALVFFGGFVEPN